MENHDTVGDAKLLAHRAVAAVAGNQPVAGDCVRRALVFECEFNRVGGFGKTD